MNDLIMKASPVTPGVHFLISGELSMEGRCISENPQEFFDNLFEWLNTYFQAPPERTILMFRFEYLNSASTKQILHLLKYFEKQLTPDREILVRWISEEDDEIIQDIGHNLQALVRIPFEFTSTE